MILRLLAVLLVVSAYGYWRISAFDLPKIAPPAPQAPPTKAEVADSVAREAVPRAMEDFDQLVARPLFRTDRRPFLPDPVAEDTALAPLPDPTPVEEWTLVGIGENADGRVALVRVPDIDQLVRAREGDIIENWIVFEVSRDFIRFISDDESESLFLQLRAD